MVLTAVVLAAMVLAAVVLAAVVLAVIVLAVVVLAAVVLAAVVLVLAVMVLAAVLLAAVFLAARPRVPARQQCGAVPPAGGRPASCLQSTALSLSVPPPVPLCPDAAEFLERAPLPPADPRTLRP